VDGRPLLLTFLVLTTVGAAALAQSPRDLVLRGNERYAAQDYSGAADLFAQAAGNPSNAAARFNEGVALAQQGKLSEAAECLKDADRRAGSTRLAARARFNLGQVLFRKAMAAEKDKPADALQLLRESAAVFRSCLDIDSNDADAARNVEIVRRRMKPLEDEQKRQQSQQGEKEDQNSKDGAQKGDGQKENNPAGAEQRKQAEELNDLAQQQEAAAEKSKQAAQQPESQRSEQEQAEQARSQEALREQTSKAAQQAGEEQQADQIQQAVNEQEKASERLKENDPKGAEQHQREAAKQLRDAARQAEQAAEQAEKQAAQERAEKASEQQAKAAQAKDTKDEKPYDQSASQLLDRERRHREARDRVLRAMRGKPQPVERDW